MRRLRRASLLLALSLLTSAATVHAECAWILWAEMTTPQGTGVVSRVWAIQAARESRNECASDLKKNIDAVNGKDLGTEYWKRLGSTDVIQFRRRTEDGLDPVINATRYVCLPDTVDPRGPKGK